MLLLAIGHEDTYTARALFVAGERTRNKHAKSQEESGEFLKEMRAKLAVFEQAMAADEALRRRAHMEAQELRAVKGKVEDLARATGE
eukprot:9476142-Pyramimonas_sp.AAC.1